MHTDSLLLAIIGHLVGDYLLQNDWMALNKKSLGLQGDLACCTHCFIWAMSVVLFAGWSAGTIIMLFIAHYAQDRTQIIKWWMTKVNRQQKFTEPPMAPWSLIVVDNVWHIVSLWAVWRFLV